MGSRIEPEVASDVIESGTEPEYFISRLLRYDLMPNGMVRLYFSSKRGRNIQRLEYSVILSTEDLVLMAREALNICGEAHNASQFRGMIERAH